MIHADYNNDGSIDGIFRVELPGSGSTIVDTNEDPNADIGWFALADGRIDVRTQWQRVPRVTLEAAGLLVDQVEEDDLDVVSGYLGLGTVVEADIVDVLPTVSVRNIGLGHDRYLTAVEGSLRAQRALGSDERLVLFGEVGGGYETFGDVDADRFASEQTGPYLTGAVGTVYTPTDRLQVVLRYRVIGKDAEEDYQAFFAHGIAGTGQYALAEGAAIRLTASWTNQRFDEPDPFVSTDTRRRDNEIEAGIGLVVTAEELFSLFGQELTGPAVDGLVLNLGARYRTVASNLPNYDYDNFRFEMSITKRFLF
jgi:hypothetical protein